MIGDELGIGHDPGQHAAYVDSWIKVLQDDPKEILRAARDADKIADYMLGLEKERVPANVEKLPRVERAAAAAPEPMPSAPAQARARAAGGRER